MSLLDAVKLARNERENPIDVNKKSSNDTVSLLNAVQSARGEKVSAPILKTSAQEPKKEEKSLFQRVTSFVGGIADTIGGLFKQNKSEPVKLQSGLTVNFTDTKKSQLKTPSIDLQPDFSVPQQEPSGKVNLKSVEAVKKTLNDIGIVLETPVLEPVMNAFPSLRKPITSVLNKAKTTKVSPLGITPQMLEEFKLPAILKIINPALSGAEATVNFAGNLASLNPTISNLIMAVAPEVTTVAGKAFVKQFGLKSVSFLANKDLLLKVTNGTANAEELARFKTLNEAGILSEARGKGVSVTELVPKEGKMWDLLRTLFPDGFTPKGEPKENELPKMIQGKIQEMNVELAKTEYSPQEIISTITNSVLKDTPDGKTLLRVAQQAQQAGKNVILDNPKLGVIEQVPQAELAKDYTSASDFAEGVYSATPDKQIGLVDAKTIIPRDPVDKLSPQYLNLKADIEKNGIKESVNVDASTGQSITVDGSHRAVIAQELGLKLPVIVNNGEIKGLKTIEDVYNDNNGEVTKGRLYDVPKEGMKLYTGQKEGWVPKIPEGENVDSLMYGKGIYLTPDKSIAEGYARGGGKLHEVMADIKNPLTPKMKDWQQFIQKSNAEQKRQYLINHGYDAVVDTTGKYKQVMVVNPEQIKMSSSTPPSTGGEIGGSSKDLSTKGGKVVEKETLDLSKEKNLSQYSEDLELVSDAIRSGDIEGARAIYDDLSKEFYTPSFNSLKAIEDRLKQRESAQQSNESAQIIKESYGQHASVVQKMKNFLRIASENKSKEGMLFREHIPKRIFGVGSDEIATDLGMSENDLMDKIINELDIQKEKVLPVPKEVEVPSKNLPIGKGEERVSRLEARMKGVLGKATQEQIDSLGLSTFNRMNRKETIAESAQYVIEHPKDALEVLQGTREPPKGIVPESIYVAMTELARGDFDLATKLTSLQASAIGQRLGLLAEIDPLNPVKIVSDIYKFRETAVEKTYAGRKVKDVVKREVEKGKAKIKPPKLTDWSSFIESVKCS